MAERRSGQKRRTWGVLVAAAVVWIVIGLEWHGCSSPRSALADESPGRPSRARRLPKDLVEVANAQYVSLDGLAAGSREAQDHQRRAVQQLDLPLEVQTRKMGIVFRLVPPGSFTMGSPLAEQDAMVKADVLRVYVEDEREHQVTLTKAFYCAKFEVTQGQWEQLMGSNPSNFKNAGEDVPVEDVSWEDCQAFVKKLCQGERVAKGTYRLLTEAEWEYACRAGTQTALYNGDSVIEGSNSSPALDPIAWYAGNSRVDYRGAYDPSGGPEKQYDHKRAGTHPVGGKRANGFGLCDMIGNVWEWCQDWRGEYPSGAATDPLGPAPPVQRVLRGGGWFSDARLCRSAYRCGRSPGDHSNGVGLRLARTIPSYP